MLYLHYGKQFVKTVLSAPPGGDAGQRLSCMPGATVYRDISLLDCLRRNKYFENSWGNLEGSKGDLGAVKGCNREWYSYQEPGLWPTADNTSPVSFAETPLIWRRRTGGCPIPINVITIISYESNDSPANLFEVNFFPRNKKFLREK